MGEPTVISQFIRRFREAAPTSPSERQEVNSKESFWWLPQQQALDRCPDAKFASDEADFQSRTDDNSVVLLSDSWDSGFLIGSGASLSPKLSTSFGATSSLAETLDEFNIDDDVLKHCDALLQEYRNENQFGKVSWTKTLESSESNSDTNSQLAATNDEILQSSHSLAFSETVHFSEQFLAEPLSQETRAVQTMDSIASICGVVDCVDSPPYTITDSSTLITDTRSSPHSQSVRKELSLCEPASTGVEQQRALVLSEVPTAVSPARSETPPRPRVEQSRPRNGRRRAQQQVDGRLSNDISAAQTDSVWVAADVSADGSSLFMYLSSSSDEEGGDEDERESSLPTAPRQRGARDSAPPPPADLISDDAVAVVGSPVEDMEGTDVGAADPSPAATSELQLSEELVAHFLDADPELQHLWAQLCCVREQLEQRTAFAV